MIEFKDKPNIGSKKNWPLFLKRLFRKVDKYAIEYNFLGGYVYFLNGEFHRDDGPAFLWAFGSGAEEWFLNGIKYTEKEYKIEMRRRKLVVLGL